jgi:hypothetical protein
VTCGPTTPCYRNPMNHDTLVDELWCLTDLYTDVDPDVAAVLGVLVSTKVAGGSNARLVTLALEVEKSELVRLEGAKWGASSGDADW